MGHNRSTQMMILLLLFTCFPLDYCLLILLDCSLSLTTYITTTTTTSYGYHGSR